MAMTDQPLILEFNMMNVVQHNIPVLSDSFACYYAYENK